MIQKELNSINFIRETFNVTLKDVANINYLNQYLKQNLFPSDKLNLDEEEEVFVNKMLLDLGENILAFLNSSNGPTINNGVNSTIIESNHTNVVSNSNFNFGLENEHIRSLMNLISLVNLKRFNVEMIVNFWNSRAKSYLPLLKSFISMFYTFIYVILDGSTVLLSYVLNFVSKKSFIFFN